MANVITMISKKMKKKNKNTYKCGKILMLLLPPRLLLIVTSIFKYGKCYADHRHVKIYILVTDIMCHANYIVHQFIIKKVKDKNADVVAIITFRYLHSHIRLVSAWLLNTFIIRYPHTR